MFNDICKICKDKTPYMIKICSKCNEKKNNEEYLEYIKRIETVDKYLREHPNEIPKVIANLLMQSRLDLSHFFIEEK